MSPFSKSLALLVAGVLLSWGAGALAGQKADLVRVDKDRGRLYLERDGEVFATFKVSLGKNPRGHKREQGDGRTPEGRYVLDYKNAASRYYRSIHVSYPNAKDRESARKRGVPPGGDIMIHGQPNGRAWLEPVSQLFNWTDGCVALRNEDMDAVWDAVDPGTPIEIAP